MNDEQELRNRLRAIEVPASRIEIDGLVRAGRRRAFRRRSVVGAGGVALATALLLTAPSILTTTGARPDAAPAGPAPGATGAPEPAGADRTATAPAAACQPSELPLPAGMKNVTAAGVDPTGRYVVGNDVVGQDFRPVLWTDGKPQALPVPGRSVQVTAVNAAGVAVGLVEDGRQEYVFRYQKGAYTRLRTPPGNWHVYPTPGINAAGDVVINAEPSGNHGGEGSIVLLWRAGSTEAVKLPLPDGANVFDITDDGTVVGAMYRKGVASAAYAWDQQGRGRKLTAPAGQTAAGYAAQGDWATGGLWPSRSAALWDLRTGALTPLTADGPGDAVNAAGWVVAGGLLLRDGAAVELRMPGGQEDLAVAVSDTGLVVGHARPGGDAENAGPRVWRC
ncbi:hypothetical protein GCM10010169_50130 [Micromonospora fulviviridis]|uniref:hypothetical protein n=1 Tax=Micromonospora fulviviridis TaxID=47860 RepID=UPI001668E601|nr:hypothetical protein [Micromonospora fulviviridis]GGR99476.1 hypothetical protein GCM10010169_50130 [Micromonospora fulviviridis]